MDCNMVFIFSKISRYDGRIMGQLEEKFGWAGKKGEEGEDFALALWDSIGYDVIDYRKDIAKQKLGIDYAVKKLKPEPWFRHYTIDNKNNLRIYKGQYSIPIEVKKGKRRPGWLYTSHADRISHTHVGKKMLVFYDLKQMRERLLPLIRNGEIALHDARSKCKMAYIDMNDKRFSNLIRKING